MPRHDWFNDDTMSRERDDWRGGSQRDDRGYGRDSGAFFDSDREDRFRSEGRFDDNRRDRMDREPRSRDFDRDSDRGREGGRERDRDRGRSEGNRDDRHFGADDYNRGIPMDETEQLIASNKVEGTPVYDRFGDKLGSIHNFMVHKTKGHVVYAVLKHGGGFLGLNERYYPLEWNQLDYDTRLGGYQTQLDEEDLQSFGSFDSEGRWQRRRSPGRSGRERGHRDEDRSRSGRERGYRDDDRSRRSMRGSR